MNKLPIIKGASQIKLSREDDCLVGWIIKI